MSKVDAQRAMREAKYARISASGPKRREAAARGETAMTPATQTSTTKPVRAAQAAVASEGGERCGHKSMNGRECTREAAHTEKSHRYS